MKNFKTFILTEGISPILYHNTSVHKLVKILEFDEFVLASDMGTHSDNNLNKHKFKPFYLSASRIKFGGFGRSFSEEYISCIVLDGKRLSERLSGASVDYWGKEFRGDIVNSKESDKEERYLRYNENEDRLFSSEGILKPAHRYIKEVHVMFCKSYVVLHDNYKEFDNLPQGEQEQAYKAMDWYKSIATHCELYSIPVYFYSNFSDFKLQNKRKAATGYSRKTVLTYIQKFLDAKSIDDLDEDAKDKLHDYMYDYRDKLISLENHIHNNKGDKAETYKLHSIVKAMNKLKIHTLKDLILHIRNKFKND